MTFVQFIITYHKYIISVAISAVFLLVNIIQAVRTHDKSKLKNALCRIPDIIRQVEVMYPELKEILSNDSTTTATRKSLIKKATAESLIKNEVGEKFFNKYVSVFDNAIEDILNTPSKKGGSYVQKENVEA